MPWSALPLWRSACAWSARQPQIVGMLRQRRLRRRRRRRRTSSRRCSPRPDSRRPPDRRATACAPPRTSRSPCRAARAPDRRSRDAAAGSLTSNGRSPACRGTRRRPARARRRPPGTGAALRALRPARSSPTGCLLFCAMTLARASLPPPAVSPRRRCACDSRYERMPSASAYARAAISSVSTSRAFVEFSRPPAFSSADA